MATRRTVQDGLGGTEIINWEACTKYGELYLMLKEALEIHPQLAEQHIQDEVHCAVEISAEYNRGDLILDIGHRTMEGQLHPLMCKPCYDAC